MLQKHIMCYYYIITVRLVHFQKQHLYHFCYNTIYTWRLFTHNCLVLFIFKWKQAEPLDTFSRALECGNRAMRSPQEVFVGGLCVKVTPEYVTRHNVLETQQIMTNVAFLSWFIKQDFIFSSRVLTPFSLASLFWLRVCFGASESCRVESWPVRAILRELDYILLAVVTVRDGRTMWLQMAFSMRQNISGWR